MEERFKLMAFCDDVKPSISCIEEFITADRAATLFEMSAGSKVSAHMFRLVHGLQPCEEHVAHTLQNTPPTCKYDCPGSPVADSVHCYLQCRLTSEVGQWLVGLVRTFNPQTTNDSLLRLNIDARNNTDAVVWINAHTLNYCWARRKVGKVANLTYCKAELTADATIC